MVLEISFHEHQSTIAQMRRDAFGSGLNQVIDEFDAAAHHFAFFNETREITGLIRLLRSDEVPKLELQCESGAQDLVWPRSGLILETSRGCGRKGASGMPIMHFSRAMDSYARQHKAAHIVSKTARHLLPLYQAMGFRIFGKPFYSDWFDDKAKQDPSIPIIYDFATALEEDVLVW
jgi:predicted GNAT family N-acyltransferase